MEVVATCQIDRINCILNEHLEVAKALHRLSQEVSEAVDMIAASLASGGQLLVAGNGGPAADAQHITAELTGRFLRDRKPLRALALHVNTSAFAAIGNDCGYEHVSPGNFRHMRGRAMSCLQSPQAATV
jgi:D-sedoheptulose 7-phosphate isomerase